MKTWITSDHHFGHANIIDYCGRPFADTKEMVREMIRRWNAVVAPGDLVYHLGDFAWWHLSLDEVRRIFEQLNGEVLLVIGNHDKHKETKKILPWISELFPNPRTSRRVTIDGIDVSLYHYGPQSWGRSDRSHRKHLARLGEPGDILLHGHSHCPGNPVRMWAVPGTDRIIPAVDMSVEGWAYAPADMSEILARVASATEPGVFG